MRLKVLHRLHQALLRVDEVSVGRSLLLCLVGDGLHESLDRRVAVLGEVLVRGLRVALGLKRVHLHGLALVDDLLDHANDAATALVLLVLLEALRGRRGGLTWLRLHEAVGLLHAVERHREDLLRGALIRHRLLELSILRLAVLAGALHLELRLVHLGLVLRQLLRERVDGVREIRDLGLQVFHRVLIEDRLLLVLRELLDAPIAVLHFVLLLHLELIDHGRDRFLHLLEARNLDLGGERDELLAAGLGGGLAESGRGLGAAVVHAARLRRQLEEAKGLAEHRVRLIRVKQRDGLSNRLELLSPRLRALLELLVGVRAADLEILKELGVRRESVLSVGLVLLRGLVLLARVSELLRLRVHHGLRLLHFLGLRRLEGREVRRGLELILLRLGKVRLERLLHLLQDTEDLARGRRVGLEAGRLLEERLDLAFLRRREMRARERLLQSRDQAVADRHNLLRIRSRLQEGLMVLRQNGNRISERLDGLKHVLLVRVELGEVLLAHSVRFAEGRIVLGDLVLELRDLLLELGGLARVSFDIGPQPLDHAVRLRDRGCLVLTVSLTPASELVIKLLVRLLLLRELGLHGFEHLDHLRNRAFLEVKGLRGVGEERRRGDARKNERENAHCSGTTFEAARS